MMQQPRGSMAAALLLPAILFVVAGCRAASAPSEGASNPASIAPSVAATASPGVAASAGPSESPAPSPSPVRSILQASPPVSPPSSPVDTSAVPPAILAAVLADATTRSGVEVEGIAIVRADATIWPSGALGCPEPGHVYTDALEPGYWIVVDAGGQRLDYRATQRGTVRLCQNPPGPG
jgi:hypothetical protein